jgi:hypothetical protein
LLKLVAVTADLDLLLLLVDLPLFTLKVAVVVALATCQADGVKVATVVTH